MKEKSKTLKMVSWEEIFIGGLINFVLDRVLGFLWRKGKETVKFEEETHVRARLAVIFIRYMLPSTFNLLLYKPQENLLDYQDSLRRFLRLHARYHELTGTQPCNMCYPIDVMKWHFQKYVPDDKLYPMLL